MRGGFFGAGFAVWVSCVAKSPKAAIDMVSVASDLAPQRDELFDPRVEFGPVSIEEFLEATQHVARRAADRVDGVQLLHVGEGQTELLVAFNEVVSLDLVWPVDAAPTRSAPHVRKQSELLVVTQRAR